MNAYLETMHSKADTLRKTRSVLVVPGGRSETVSVGTSSSAPPPECVRLMFADGTAFPLAITRRFFSDKSHCDGCGSNSSRLFDGLDTGLLDDLRSFETRLST